jgi:hypothetical protein
MNAQTDFTVKAESEDFKNTLFLAMELSRATWLVATFAPRLGDKINVQHRLEAALGALSVGAAAGLVED